MAGMSLARWPRCPGCGAFCNTHLRTCGAELCELAATERATMDYHVRALVAAVGYITERLVPPKGPA